MDPLAYVYGGREGSGAAQIFQTTEARSAGDRAIGKVEKDLQEARIQQKEADAMMKDLTDLSLSDWDIDNQRFIFDEINEYQNKAVDLYKKGINVNGVTDWESYASLNREKKRIETLVQSSNAQNLEYKKVLAGLSSGKFVDNDEKRAALAEYRSATPEQRRDMDITALLVPKLDVNDYASKMLKDIPSDVRSENERTIKPGLMGYEEVTYRDPDVVASVAQSAWLANPVLQGNVGLAEYVKLAQDKNISTRSPKTSRFHVGASPKPSKDEPPIPDASPVNVVDGKSYSARDMNGQMVNLSGEVRAVSLTQYRPKTGSAQVEILDPVSNNVVKITPNQIVEKDGAYYLIGRTPDFITKTESKSGSTDTAKDAKVDVSKKEELTTDGQSGSKTSIGKTVTATDSRGQTTTTQNQTVIIPLMDSNSETLLQSLRITAKYRSIAEMFGVGADVGDGTVGSDFWDDGL